MIKVDPNAARALRESPEIPAISEGLIDAVDIRIAERSLHDFIRQAWHIVEPGTEFIDGWHIRLICKKLETARSGYHRDYLFNIPPGHSKSLMVSVFWPCWVWTTQPFTDWLFASYSEDISMRDSMKRRIILHSPWFQDRWGHQVEFNPEEDSKTKYGNKKSGTMIATSIGGGALGRHPDYIVVDDPLKTSEADRPKERQRVIDWWTGTIATRGAIRGVRRIVIMQRLNELDLSQYIIDNEDTFEHVCLPARYEKEHPYVCGDDPRIDEGQVLWPGAFSEAVLDRINMPSFRKAGQLQQRPAPAEGGLFHYSDFQLVDRVPDAEYFREEGKSLIAIKRVRFWDLASIADEHGDYTAGVKVAKTPDGRYYIEHVMRGHWTPDRRDKTMKSTAQTDGRKIKVGIELQPGAAGVSLKDYLSKTLAGFVVRHQRPTGDKVTRAEPLAAAVENGLVSMVKADWNREFLDEICTFPNASHDDMVDAASGAFNYLTQGRRLVIGGPPDGKEKQTTELAGHGEPLVAGRTRRGYFSL